MPRRPTLYESVKGVVEWCSALALLVAAAPLIVFLGGLVRATSPGPIFYWQVRRGRGGRRFVLGKLRTMTADCEARTGPRWSLPGDPRVTPFGRFLRASHLDELPQLWNVLCGEMGLIGPRPERPELTPMLEREVPNYLDREQVRPGLTGLAQLHLPPDVDIDGVRLKLEYDLYYIRNQSLRLDLNILYKTVRKVALGLGSAVSLALPLSMGGGGGPVTTTVDRIGS